MPFMLVLHFLSTTSHVLWTYTFSPVYILSTSIQHFAYVQMLDASTENVLGMNVVSPLQNVLVNYCMPTCSLIPSFFPIYHTGDSMRNSLGMRLAYMH